jgi:hypothetical protein
MQMEPSTRRVIRQRARPSDGDTGVVQLATDHEAEIVAFGNGHRRRDFLSVAAASPHDDAVALLRNRASVIAVHRRQLGDLGGSVRSDSTARSCPSRTARSEAMIQSA